MPAGRAARFEGRKQALAALRGFLEGNRLAPSAAAERVFRDAGTAPLRQAASLAELLTRPEIGLALLRPLVEGWPDADPRDEETVEVEIKYAGYVRRDLETLERVRRLEHTALPADLDYGRVGGLTEEVRQALAAVRPLSLGQAQRIRGMRPAAVSALLVHLRKTGAL